MRYIFLTFCIFLAPLLSLAQEPSSSANEPETGENIPAIPPKVPESEIVPQVEVMPRFPGGQNALMRYLSLNLRYPYEAMENGVQGSVLVQFVVCEDGSLCNEQFMKTLGSGCEQEVLRVLRSMPPWEPGTVEGKPVKTYFRLPVTFRFAEEIEETKE